MIIEGPSELSRSPDRPGIVTRREGRRDGLDRPTRGLPNRDGSAKLSGVGECESGWGKAGDGIEGPGGGQPEHAGLRVAAQDGHRALRARADLLWPAARPMAGLRTDPGAPGDPPMDRPHAVPDRRRGGLAVRPGGPSGKAGPSPRPGDRAGPIRDDRPPGAARVRGRRGPGPGVPLAIGRRRHRLGPARSGLALG